MADKKPDKKSDKKSEAPSGGDGHDFAFKFIFFVIIFFAISSILASFGLFKGQNKETYNLYSTSTTENIFSTSSSDSNSDEKFKWSDLSFSNLFPLGNVSIGKQIANKKDALIRNLPGGQILGTQKSGILGTIIEGPISKFGKNWWRVDYSEAPDGWITSDDMTGYGDLFRVWHFFPWLFSNLKGILVSIGILALIIIFIIRLKHKKINQIKKQRKELKKEQTAAKNLEEEIKNNPNAGLPVPGLPIGEAPQTEDVTNKRWRNIKSLIHSHNTNDWRQAIIEADIILEEMLDKMGYHGDTMGDQFKQIEASDFLTLNQAMEAHGVRNRIAHQGRDFILSKDEAERVIGLYEEVFNEFYLI